MKARKIRTMDREGNVVDVLGLVGAQGANGQPGADGTTPHIGENGNWFIGDTDTGVPARGEGGGSGSGIIDETDPTVFVWAKSHLPFTVAQLSAMANGAGFVVNPTNFADGKTYFRYHAGANSFTWTNPNPQRGAVTITVLAWSQYGDKNTANAFSALNIVYGDGTTGRLSLVNGQTVTMTTDAGKVLEEIRGNYDHENWVLLDMSVLSIVADYPAPSGSVKSVNGIEPDEAGNVEIDIPESTDANAVHYTADTPTEEQQMQARANLDLYWKEKVYNVIASFLYVGWWEADSADNLWRGREMNVTISGVGTFATRWRMTLEDGTYGAAYHCVCYGNSSLVTDIPEEIKPDNLYPDYPFLVYAFDGDYGTKGWTVVFDDSISKTMGTTVTFTSTTEYTEKYHPVPAEYLPFLTGATSDTDGASGLVPAPAAGDEGKFLAGDGTWKTPESSGGGSGNQCSCNEYTFTAEITADGTVSSYEFTEDADGNPLALDEVWIKQYHAENGDYNYIFINDVKVSYRHARNAGVYENIHLVRFGDAVCGFVGHTTNDDIGGMNAGIETVGFKLPFLNGEKIQKIRLSDIGTFKEGDTIKLYGR